MAGRFAAMATQALRGGSRLVKTIGDEVMIVSPDTAAAARTALELARLVEAEPLFPGVRAGLHRGPAVERAGDYYGAAVNLAARVAAHARSGQILCSEAVAGDLEGADEIICTPAGLGHFKNVSEPCALFEVTDSAREGAPFEVDPVCRMQVRPHEAAGRLTYAGRPWHFCSLECVRAFAEHPDRYASETGG